jgi:hypothetical protein
MRDALERVWKQSVVTCFQEVCQYLSVGSVEIHEYLSQDRQSPNRDSGPGFPKYESGILISTPVTFDFSNIHMMYHSPRNNLCGSVVSGVVTIGLCVTCIQLLCILSTKCIYGFRMILRIYSVCFLISFEVRTEFLHII